MIALRQDQIEFLRQQITRLQGRTRRHQTAAIVRSGGLLAQLLPEQGFRRGTLVEWLGDGEATGATVLAVVVAAAAAGDGRAVVVIDRQRQFYPPAAIRWGIELQQLILVYPQHQADHDWAVDQSLRCPAVAATLSWPAKLPTRTFRRWQLAAEQGGGLGLLIRPQKAAREPSWAALRLGVKPLPTKGLQPGKRRMRVSLLRGHGPTQGQSIEVEIDDETHPLPLAARLVDPTARCRAAGIY